MFLFFFLFLFLLSPLSLCDYSSQCCILPMPHFANRDVNAQALSRTPIFKTPLFLGYWGWVVTEHEFCRWVLVLSQEEGFLFCFQPVSFARLLSCVREIVVWFPHLCRAAVQHLASLLGSGWDRSIRAVSALIPPLVQALRTMLFFSLLNCYIK